MKQLFLSNIDLSSEVIVFDKQTHQGELIINNQHNTLGVIFKIKTTKLNVIEVKPAKGYIKPMGKVLIVFKLSQKVSAQEMQSLQRNDKFQLQFLNVSNKQATREQVEDIWKAYKNNTANLEHGYGCYKIFMNFTGKRVSYNSSSKSQIFSSKASQSAIKSVINTKQNEPSMRSSVNSERQSVNDDELAKKYEDLKQKQLELGLKRQDIFLSKSSISKNSSGGLSVKYLIILVFFFLLAFLAGNYLRSSMVRAKPVQKIKKHEYLFSSCLNWLNWFN